MRVDYEVHNIVAVERLSYPRAYVVIDHRGEPIVGYKNSKFAEDFAQGHVACLFNEAEDENERRDRIAAYLALRAARPVKEPDQFAFNF